MLSAEALANISHIRVGLPFKERKKELKKCSR